MPKKKSCKAGIMEVTENKNTMVDNASSDQPTIFLTFFLELFLLT